MLTNDIMGLGMNNNDFFKSASAGHSSPYQESMRMSFDGMTAPTKAQDLQNPKLKRLKDINEAPKPKKTPIFTERGRVIVIVTILAFAVYVVYKSHQAKKQEATPQLAEGGEPTPSGPIAEPIEPAPIVATDNSPSAAEIK